MRAFIMATSGIVPDILVANINDKGHAFFLGPFSIYVLAMSQPLSQDVAYVTSSLIGWVAAQPSNRKWAQVYGHYKEAGGREIILFL